MLGLGGAAAVAAPVVAKAVEPPPSLQEQMERRIDSNLKQQVDSVMVTGPSGLFQFNVEGPIRKGDFVTLADGGYTVRAGGFDENEHLLGIVTELCEDGTAWVQLATDD